MAKFVCFNEIIVYFTDDSYELGRPSGGGGSRGILTCAKVL